METETPTKGKWKRRGRKRVFVVRDQGFHHNPMIWKKCGVSELF